MFQFLSVLCAIVAVVFMVPGIIPFFGWLQWAVLVLVVIGSFFGAFCEKKIGLTINVIIGVVAVVRLFLGGGGF
jgi:hypothetical protein